MGQQTSRKSGECTCGCGAWERRREGDSPSSVHRYVSAVTDRWSGRECACRRRRWRRPACVCTAYRRVSDACHDDRLAAVLTLGARDLRRELDAIVINTDGDTGRDIGEPTAEVYVLSVGPRTDGESSAEGRTTELVQASDQSIRRFQVVCGGELRALLLRGPLPAAPPPPTVHTQVDYKHCLVPDLQEITACSFYWGKMDRYEAERLLDNKPEGTFLLRDSAQEEHLFSVSFRKYGRSLHARIEHYQHRFSFDSHDPGVFAAPTVTGLIEHYKVTPPCATPPPPPPHTNEPPSPAGPGVRDVLRADADGAPAALVALRPAAAGARRGGVSRQLRRRGAPAAAGPPARLPQGVPLPSARARAPPRERLLRARLARAVPPAAAGAPAAAAAPALGLRAVSAVPVGLCVG